MDYCESTPESPDSKSSMHFLQCISMAISYFGKSFYAQSQFSSKSTFRSGLISKIKYEV